MSHYPSTAELASFRRSIGAGPSDTPLPIHRNGVDGAWSWERDRGIGYSGGSPTAPFLIHEADGGPFPMGYAVSCAWADAYDHSWARKVAGSMRKRAFRRIFGDGVTWPEVTTFAPLPHDDDTLSCDVCGRYECAADLTPDWNGETGAHRSCETASA